MSLLSQSQQENQEIQIKQEKQTNKNPQMPSSTTHSLRDICPKQNQKPFPCCKSSIKCWRSPLLSGCRARGTVLRKKSQDSCLDSSQDSVTGADRPQAKISCLACQIRRRTPAHRPNRHQSQSWDLEYASRKEYLRGSWVRKRESKPQICLPKIGELGKLKANLKVWLKSCSWTY